MTTEHVVWLTVDEDGTELVGDETGHWIIVPNGTIEKLIGRKLTLQDDTFEYRG